MTTTNGNRELIRQRIADGGASTDALIQDLAQSYMALAEILARHGQGTGAANVPADGLAQEMLVDSILDHMTELASMLAGLQASSAAAIRAKASVLRDWCDTAEPSLHDALTLSLLGDIERRGWAR